MSRMSSSSDEWGIGSAAYAATAEYVTRPCAEQLIEWVNSESPLSTPSASAFDNGAGSGVVTTTLRARFPNLPILAADLSPGMLETLRKTNYLPKVQYQAVDAIDLGQRIADNNFTHSLSTFMLQFTPDPFRALKEMHRVTKPGGTLGLCMWAESCFHATWEETVRCFDEPNYTYPYSWPPGWADEDRLREYIHEAGFKDIRMKTIRPKFDFESPEEYSEFYLESSNPDFMRGYQPYWDRGLEGTMRPVLEKIVREKYNGAQDFDMKALLFLARK